MEELLVSNSIIKRNILVIDDNQINQEILKDILSDNYNVFTADNGKEGLDVLSKHYQEITIIILDLHMPIMDGYQFLEKKGENSLFSNIPVIVLTANGSEEDEIRCLHLGAVDFLVKPFVAEIVKSRITNTIKLYDTENTLKNVVYDEVTGALTAPAFYLQSDEIIKSNEDNKFGIVCIKLKGIDSLNRVLGENRVNEILKLVCCKVKEYYGTSIISRLGCNFYLLANNDCMTNDEEHKVHIKNNLEKYELTGLQVDVFFYQHIEKTQNSKEICELLTSALAFVGGNCAIEFFYFDDTIREKIEEQKQIESSFEKAIKNGEIVLFFQPKVDAKTGEIVSCEALSRWIGKDGKRIMPNMFIPLLEKSGKINYLDEYVFKNVCLYQKERLEKGKNVYPISVNISRNSVYSNDTVSRYSEIIEEIGISHDLVPIELTESATAEGDAINRITNEFSKAGFVLCMDDFGMGQSSLTELCALPFSVVKLDRKFVQLIDTPNGKTVAEAMIDIAHRIGLKVVAEGVETEAQAEFMRNADCDMIQGFYYYKPQGREDFEKLIG